MLQRLTLPLLVLGAAASARAGEPEGEPPPGSPPVAPGPEAPAPEPPSTAGPGAEPAPSDEELHEFVIHAADPDQASAQSRATLDAEALARSAGADLAETLAQLPGLTVQAGTADVSKPMLRGHTERRLLVLFDGVRHESQKWGPDHATEIDPFAAGAIHVIRGAAGARYGPDAIGGVILIEAPELRRLPGVGGRALTSFASNGLRSYAALRLDAAPAKVPGLSLRVHGDVARGANLSTPTYVLGNTASFTFNVGATARYAWDTGYVQARWAHYDLKAGVFYGVQSSSPTAFAEQLDAERPVTADLWRVSFPIDRPRQEVSHDLAALDLQSALGPQVTLRATYALQLNHREEFEQVRNGDEVGAQYDFTLRTHSLDLALAHDDVWAGDVRLRGEIGAQGLFQENVYRGLTLLPNYRSFAVGAFATGRMSLPRADLELGVRYDHLARTSWLSELDRERHERRGNLEGLDCEDAQTGARCAASYDAASVSLGGLVHLVPEHLDLKVDLSTASRFPNVDELFLYGNAPTFPVYAIGSPTLGVETTWGGQGSLGLRTRWLDAELGGYASFIEDYIYFAPELDADGGLHVDVTIRGAWPRYTWRPIDALVYGADGLVALLPEAPVGLDARGALVRMRDAQTEAYLIGAPPDHLNLRLIGRAPERDPLHRLELYVEADLVARQTRTDLAADFAPPPPGYVLLGLGADAQIHVAGRLMRVGLDVRNLLDARYRSYTSLLRYYADQPGRDVQVRVGFDF
jgi:iron complex outermembrane receptor protein